MFGAVLFLAASGLVAESTNAQGRVIRAISTSVPGGVQSQVPISIVLESQGNESSISFSLNFNPLVLTNPFVDLGSGIPAGTTLEVNSNNLAQGQLGIRVNSTNTFAAGTRDLITVTFTVPPISPGTYPIFFGSVPTPQSVLSSTGHPLPTTYEPGNVVSGFNDPSRALIAPNVSVPGGVQTPVTVPIRLESFGDESSISFSLNFNPQVLTNPVVALGSSVPAGSTLEINTNNLADGQLGIRINSPSTYGAGTRNIVNITFTVPASAPAGTHLIRFGSVPTPQRVSNSAGASLPTLYYQGKIAVGTGQQFRVIHAPNISIPGGVQTQVTVPIMLESQGGESSISFSLNFDPQVLTNPIVALGVAVPTGSSLEVNTNNLALGQLGISVNPTSTYAAGTRNIIRVTFTVPANAPVGIHRIRFGSVPTPQSVLSSTGEPLLTTYEQGAVVIGVTAARVEVSGRVLTPDGRGLRNAIVVLTDAVGNRRLATTSSFGEYSFDNIESGQAYAISVNSKRYRLASRVVQIVDALTNFDFVGME